jgi:hypothetical protein
MEWDTMLPFVTHKNISILSKSVLKGENNLHKKCLVQCPYKCAVFKLGKMG